VIEVGSWPGRTLRKIASSAAFLGICAIEAGVAIARTSG
jgi:hypothetical protein